MLSSESFNSDENDVLVGLIDPKLPIPEFPAPVPVPVPVAAGRKRADPPTLMRLFLSGVIGSDEFAVVVEEVDDDDDEGANERRFPGDAVAADVIVAAVLRPASG